MRFKWYRDLSLTSILGASILALLRIAHGGTWPIRPDDWLNAVLPEVIVGFAEMTRPSKAFYRQWRRMRRFKDQVPSLVKDTLE